MPFPIVPNNFIITLSGVPEVLADFSSARNIAKGVLSQEQGDVKLPLIAYDSRSLSIQEKKYGIIDNYVKVYTDHPVQTSSANGKHWRWWSKV